MRSLQTLSIVCGQGGLNTSKSPDVVRDVDLTVVESITYEDDTWKKDGGAAKFNATAIPAPNNNVISMAEFGAELVCLAGDRLVVFDSTGTLTKTVYTYGFQFSPEDRQMVAGYNGSVSALYVFNSQAYPLVYTGGASITTMVSTVGVVTADNTTDTFTLTAHGLANDTVVMFYNSGGAMPAGLSANFPYYVRNTAANTFQVSLSVGGAVTNFTTNGTGTLTVTRCLLPVDVISGSQISWGFLHGGRMYMGTVYASKSHNVYASKLNNHNDFINAGSLLFQVYPGEGDGIIGGISWRGRAYIFKYPTGIYYLDDSSTNTADWGWKRLSRFVGAISSSCIVEADDEVYFISQYGQINALSAVTEFGDAKASAVNPRGMGSYILDQIYTPLDRRTIGIYHEKKRKVIFGYTNLASLSQVGDFANVLSVGVDIHQGGSDSALTPYGGQIFSSTRDQMEGLAIYTDPSTNQKVVLAGQRNGYIYKLDQTAYSKDGAGYLSAFETKEFYPYGNERNASMRELEVVFAPTSSGNTVLISVYQDGVLSTSATLTDASPRMRLFGDCRRFRIRGENSTINEKFSVARIDVRFTASNQR